ncbi:MAG TPA: hypothetical protein VKI62_06750, partial [Bacteroidota bacterium]|nr:hypothetical protein [Bacteroidota bacterium]
MNNLTDGRYCIIEADSANWIRLGYVLNGIPISTTNDTLSVTLTGGQRDSIDFVNAPPIYSQLFRTFDQDSLANDVDNKGKVGKPVSRKAIADDFAFNLTAPAHVALTAKFSMVSTGVVVHNGDTVSTWTDSKSVTTTAIDTTGGHTSVTLIGRGFSGKPVNTTYTWATLPKATKSAAVSTYLYNIPRLPMPNRVNGLMESYAKVYATSGILIGKDYTSFADSAKIYGWLLTKKYTDVLKTLYAKGATQSGPQNHGFDIFLNNSKPLVKRQSSLPPAKYNNILLADLLALKVNIAMSEVGITPPGFGNLLCQVDSSRMYGTFHQHSLGQKLWQYISDISAYGDTLMMGWQVDSTYTKGTKTIHVPVHHFAESSYFSYLDSIVHNINAAFEGPIDTSSFADSLVYKGTR